MIITLRRCHRNSGEESADKFMLGDNSDTVPPESIPNSEVKRISGDGSVGFPHVRVAHRQAPIRRKAYLRVSLFLCLQESHTATVTPQY